MARKTFQIGELSRARLTASAAIRVPTIRVVRVPTIQDDRIDFQRLFSLTEELKPEANPRGSKLKLSFADCEGLRPNACAVIGGLCILLDQTGVEVSIDATTLRVPVREILRDMGILQMFTGERPAANSSAIQFQHFAKREVSVIKQHLRTDWLREDWVDMDDDVADAIASKVWELYENAFEHAESPIGVCSCGQHFDRTAQVKLSVVDFGGGIPDRVRKYRASRDDKCTVSEAMEWALEKGNSTKGAEFSRGLGLGVLHDFVVLNKGKLEIYSHQGHVMIDGAKEPEDRVTIKELGQPFRGTLVNITIRCDNQHYYFDHDHTAESIF